MEQIELTEELLEKKELLNQYSGILEDIRGTLIKYKKYIDPKKFIQLFYGMKIGLMPKLGSHGFIKVRDDGVILISKDGLDGVSGENALTQILLTKLFPNNAEDNNLDGIYAGMRELVANSSAGGSNTSDEYIIANALEDVLEPEIGDESINHLHKAYFSEDMQSLVDVLRKKFGKKKADGLIGMISINHMRSEKLLPDILCQLIDMKFAQLEPNIKNDSYFDNIHYAGSSETPDPELMGVHKYYLAQKAKYLGISPTDLNMEISYNSEETMEMPDLSSGRAI